MCCYPENVRILFPNDQLLQDKGVEGYIAMPLLGTGRVPLGILVAMHRSSIHNPERARSLLKIFAARTAAELQRKIDEDRLRKLSYAVAQSPASIVITDTRGRIEFVNPKFTRVTGYSADEIIGRTPAILKSGETPSAVYHELWDAIEHGCEWEGVFHNRRKDGELYWEHAYIGPIKDDHGVITNYIGIKEDISEQKRLEGALRHAQKMEAVGQLAGGIAHDFNNILTAVIGYASILEIGAGQDAQMNHGVQQIIKAAERGANLTKSLLTFSRRQAANMQTIDLNEIIMRSEKLLCHLIKETVELKIDLLDHPLMVNVDGMEIEQVLMNLITNSRDAMIRGGTIRLETGQATVDHQFIKEHGFGIPGQYAVISVKDSGSGMDEKTAEKIFEPFFTTKENGKGTGLGLAIVYNIIKSHKGNIVCTSKLGEGTSFTIYLPQLTADLAPAVETPLGLLRKGHELVLLVEDETEIRDLMRQFLVDYGYRVIVAADGAEAIVKFNGKMDEIELVVLDAGLPRVSGSDALAAMRQKRPALKGIIVSGYANNTRITEETGHITRFLAKPIGPTDLVRAVREELDR
jgi:two-component system NtrC family sensor kinase